MKFVWPMLLLSGIAQAGMDGTKASGLRDSCKAWTVRYPAKAALPLDGFTEGACRGYIAGWASAMEGTMVPDDNGILGTVTFESGVTDIQMAKVYVLYIEHHPEEENKPSHVALIHSMLDAKLVTIVAPVKGEK